MTVPGQQYRTKDCEKLVLDGGYKTDSPFFRKSVGQSLSDNPNFRQIKRGMYFRLKDDGAEPSNEVQAQTA